MADRTQNRMKSNRYLVHKEAESGKRRAVSCLVCEEGERIDKIEFVVGVLEHPPLTAILRTICETGPRRRRVPRERITLSRLGLSNSRETWRKDSIVGWYTERSRRTTLWICAWQTDGKLVEKGSVTEGQGGVAFAKQAGTGGGDVFAQSERYVGSEYPGKEVWLGHSRRKRSTSFSADS